MKERVQCKLLNETVQKTKYKKEGGGTWGNPYKNKVVPVRRRRGDVRT